MRTYKIKEIFGPTLQGEGSKSGTVVKFVRFSGCNQWDGRPQTKAKSRCPYCDTDFFGGTPMTLQDIIAELKKSDDHVKDIVISGGEPLLQVDSAFVRGMSAEGYRLHLETNGTREIPDLRYWRHITISPKVGRDQMKAQYCHDLKILYPYPQPDISIELFDDFNCVHKFLQPVAGGPEYEQNVKDTIEVLKKNPDWRLSLQTHKILGVQ